MKQLYRSFFHCSFEMVLCTDMEGKVLFINKLFKKTMGIENYPDFKGSSFKLLFATPATFDQLVDTLNESRNLSTKRIDLVSLNGVRVIGLLNAHKYTNDENELVLNWFILNVTEQVNSENELKQMNEELKKINHQMEKFLYSTSHDLRSPITSILGLLNLVRMETRDPTVLDYMLKVEASTNKLDKVIRDVNSFAKTSYKRIASEKIDFEPLTWTLINRFKNGSSAQKINVEVVVTGGYPFYTDPDMLEIVMENVIRNAIYFCDATKSHPFLKVLISKNQKEVEIEFIDNGLGIGKQHQELIFNMFYKASHIAKGAGLGLYIVKETLSRLKGRVTVESETGFGSVFRVSIPNDPKGKLIGHKLQLSSQN